MTIDPNISLQKKRRFSTALHLITSLYGLAYLIFVIDNFTPADNVNPYDLENIVIKLLFVLFLVGYQISWKNEGIAGIVFIFWWIVMWDLKLSITAHDRGSGVVMGCHSLFWVISSLLRGIKREVDWANIVEHAHSFAALGNQGNVSVLTHCVLHAQS